MTKKKYSTTSKWKVIIPSTMDTPNGNNDVESLTVYDYM